MARIPITLSRTGNMAHVPLAVLGYALRHAGVLDPLLELGLPIKTLSHTPGEKLVEALVLILAGGRATYQADRILRPNLGLAHAWGQARFAELRYAGGRRSSPAAERTCSPGLIQSLSASCRRASSRGASTPTPIIPPAARCEPLAHFLHA